MEIFNEKVDYANPLLSLKIFQSNRTNDSVGNWHYHKEIEILVVLEGRLGIYVEEGYHTLLQGDVLLIGSSQLHRDRIFAEAPIRYYVLQFDIQPYLEQSMMPYVKFFSETNQPFSALNYIFQENPDARAGIFQAVSDIFQETQERTPGYEIAVSLLIKKMLLQLLRSDSRKLMNFQSDDELTRLKPVLDYIDEHLSDKIQIAEVSKIANVSYYYFVKYFKRVIGVSFTEYVNFKKIKRAEKILLTHNTTVMEIGEAVGMPNMAHFYKIFRRHNHCSPSEYRKKMLAWSAQ